MQFWKKKTEYLKWVQEAKYDLHMYLNGECKKKQISSGEQSVPTTHRGRILLNSARLS